MSAIEIVRASIPVPGRLRVESIDQQECVVVVRVSFTQSPRCPACTSARVSYHSQYDRRLRDLPWQGRPVQLRLRTRRFRCRNDACSRKIFAECVPEVAAARARASHRVCELVGRVGYALGGPPAARLLGHLGIARSADTVLRRVKARARTRTRPRVRVLGVDDWAWRKRQRYGTLLMDLEHGRVIDLLPDRSARSFAVWLRGQPTVEIISRDRCGLHAGGARQGAPAAQQITDRYHLVSNLAEALERDLQRLQIEARAEPRVAQMIDPPTLRPTVIEARRQRCRQARLDRFQTVIDLGRRGHRHYAIEKQVGISAGTVSRWLQAPAFPERQIRSDQRRERAPFWVRYARDRQLPARHANYSSGRLASLLLHPERRSPDQKRHVEAFLRACPQARDRRRLALQFRALLRWRTAKRLAAWMHMR